jgi:hypothetical protein
MADNIPENREADGEEMEAEAMEDGAEEEKSGEDSRTQAPMKRKQHPPAEEEEEVASEETVNNQQKSPKKKRLLLKKVKMEQTARKTTQAKGKAPAADGSKSLKPQGILKKAKRKSDA